MLVQVLEPITICRWADGFPAGTYGELLPQWETMKHDVHKLIDHFNIKKNTPEGEAGMPKMRAREIKSKDRGVPSRKFASTKKTKNRHCS